VTIEREVITDQQMRQTANIALSSGTGPEVIYYAPGDANQARAAADQTVAEFWKGVDDAAMEKNGELPWYRTQQSSTAG
jgi:hypothetical protein